MGVWRLPKCSKKFASKWSKIKSSLEGLAPSKMLQKTFQSGAKSNPPWRAWRLPKCSKKLFKVEQNQILLGGPGAFQNAPKFFSKWSKIKSSLESLAPSKMLQKFISKW